MTATREQLAWAAGIFEGEGCISLLRRRSPRSDIHSVMVSMYMTDRDVIERFSEIVSIGHLTHGPFKKDTNLLGHVWQTGKFEHAQALIALLWPWLGDRRRARAVEVLQATHNTRSKKWA